MVETQSKTASNSYARALFFFRFFPSISVTSLGSPIRILFEFDEEDLPVVDGSSTPAGFKNPVATRLTVRSCGVLEDGTGGRGSLPPLSSRINICAVLVRFESFTFVVRGA